MLTYADVIGHEQIISHLQQVKRTGKVSHAYCFSGEDGSGKRMLAKLFAGSLQCEATGEETCPCGRCKSCMQAESDNHPDIIFVTHEKASIGVDEIREQVVQDVEIKPYQGPYKVYIIDEAERMTEQAQNALLKTIEEPPDYAVIILLTNNEMAMLRTILSRCVKLSFYAVDNTLIQQFLTQKFGLSESRAKTVTIFSEGNVGRAILYAPVEELSTIRTICIQIVKRIQELSGVELAEMIREQATEPGKKSPNRSTVAEYTHFLILWFRDVLLYKATKNINLLLYQDEAAECRRQAVLYSYEGLEKVLHGLEAFDTQNNANVGFDAAAEVLFATIHENIGGN